MSSKIKISVNEALVFIGLQELGSTAAVARKLSIGTAAINAAISKLEEKLGKTLFSRNRRTGQFHLTNDGSKISNYVRLMLQYAETISEGGSSDDNSVILSSTHTILEYMVGPYLSSFMEKHPDITMGFQQNDSLKFQERKWNEIILTSFVDDIANYHYIPYHSFKQKLWASKEYIIKYGNPSSVEELIKHKLLMRRDVEEPRALFGSSYIKSRLTDIKDIKIIDVYGARIIDFLCEKGWGIMSGAEECLKLGNINVHNVFPDFKGDSIQIFVGLSKEFYETATARKTINWLFESRNMALWNLNTEPSYSYTPLDVK